MIPIPVANQSACFSFSTAKYSQKLHKKHSKRTAAHRNRWFYSLDHQIAVCMWACPTSLQVHLYVIFILPLQSVGVV